ncbi:hypothetical protein V5O48_018440, partial [Marasmius crinis-equi]
MAPQQTLPATMSQQPQADPVESRNTVTRCRRKPKARPTSAQRPAIPGRVIPNIKPGAHNWREALRQWTEPSREQGDLALKDWPA